MTETTYTNSAYGPENGVIQFGSFGSWLFDIALRLAQGGESIDSAQDREPVKRLAEPFRVSDFACLRRSAFAQAGASNLLNQSPAPLHTPGGCFQKAPSFGRGFLTLARNRLCSSLTSPYLERSLP